MKFIQQQIMCKRCYQYITFNINVTNLVLDSVLDSYSKCCFGSKWHGRFFVKRLMHEADANDFDEFDAKLVDITEVKEL